MDIPNLARMAERRRGVSEPLSITESAAERALELYPHLYSGEAEDDGPRYRGRRHQQLQYLLQSISELAEKILEDTGHDSGMSYLLDALDAPVQIADHRGCVLHENKALTRLLARDEEGGTAYARMRELACAIFAGSGDVRNEGPRAQTYELRTRRHRYRLHGVLVAGGAMSSEDVVVLNVRTLTPELPTAEMLTRRLGLTQSQSRVALLIAEGHSNEEIAKILSISKHTVRHHAEQVLSKLGVTSRAAVGLAILRY